MNTDIWIENLSDNKSNPEESEEKESEEEIDEWASQIIIRPDYTDDRISEIAPRISSILQGSSYLQKGYEKAEANLFEKIFRWMRKVKFKLIML